MSLAVASQRFERIAGKDGKILERRGGFQPVEFQAWPQQATTVGLTAPGPSPLPR